MFSNNLLTTILPVSVMMISFAKTLCADHVSKDFSKELTNCFLELMLINAEDYRLNDLRSRWSNNCKIKQYIAQLTRFELLPKMFKGRLWTTPDPDDHSPSAQLRAEDFYACIIQLTYKFTSFVWSWFRSASKVFDTLMKKSLVFEHSTAGCYFDFYYD